MKTRFWQKIYIFTLLLFLICLNVGILSLAYYTYDRNAKALEEALTAEQYYIAESFERDYADLYAQGAQGSSPSLLIQSYGSYYKKRGIFLCFTEGEKTTYSFFDEELPNIENNSIVRKNLGGNKYLIISTALCDGKYQMCYGKDIGALDEEFKNMALIFGAVSAGISLILAMVLFLMMKTMSRPLEKLKESTKKIAQGDYSVHIEEKGRDEFADLARSFNYMTGQVNDRTHALHVQAEKNRRLVDNMAHEIRTPLTSIKGYAEFVAHAAADEETKLEAAQRIVLESERLSKLSEKILEMAVIRQETLEKKECSSMKLVRQTSELLLSVAEKRGVTLCFKGEDFVLLADENLMGMLLYNLTENALKACESGGSVELSCLEEEGKQSFYVSDNGRGMTQEQLSHITEPFYRTDKARSRKDGGAGLGLALCAEIAQLHGATLHFRSELRQGTTASIIFEKQE
ncbi:MAG: HAMP domain-containing histidine kinase [Clostridia bacterium]|nr:HAMP domain-containing histidine kinase [Clostridia bacterium]